MIAQTTCEPQSGSRCGLDHTDRSCTGLTQFTCTFNMAAETAPGLSCPTCSNVFGGPGSATAPWKMKCGHVVCGVCVEAAKALKFVACPVCKTETGGLYMESTGLGVFAAKEHARLHPEEAKIVLCEDCVA